MPPHYSPYFSRKPETVTCDGCGNRETVRFAPRTPWKRCLSEECNGKMIIGSPEQGKKFVWLKCDESFLHVSIDESYYDCYHCRERHEIGITVGFQMCGQDMYNSETPSEKASKRKRKMEDQKAHEREKVKRMKVQDTEEDGKENMKDDKLEQMKENDNEVASAVVADILNALCV